ncbi:glycosyl transferase family 1 [Herbaspirillum rubrisubalbicans]|uniref:Glycosyl transferase family 1 n=1 Tax=Herbaspirillum rubrisubalbicans TaxID=80842 RepID=A0ABX9C3M5_9BURK|nr:MULTISPECIES: FxDxF family PEP-CTERM protein [Herbaspirillum]MCP1573481.1 hypothetical protein [Herbaspirillum rubrisubalbicans]NQE47780.1 glycosyl transferase family 1 [Herbaspirillum rubrisubalbicans]RAM65061.1 glycosyl transferase family 1 [Herbaspirillum rubrisubalbicans]RAN48292.1 glycosyl transferase family 1 [Herbaspirillum rubrisubalbicans]
MKKLSSSFLVASTLLAMACSAGAADIQQSQALVWTDTTSTFDARFGAGTKDKSFLEKFTFTINSTGSSLSSALVSIALGGISRVDISGFTLSGHGQNYVGTQVLSGDLQIFSLRANGLSTGLYTLAVAGTVLGSAGGSFAGNISVAPVPEASTTAMMLGGLGLIGFAAYRRRKSGDKTEQMNGAQMMAA